MKKISNKLETTNKETNKKNSKKPKQNNNTTKKKLVENNKNTKQTTNQMKISKYLEKVEKAEKSKERENPAHPKLVMKEKNEATNTTKTTSIQPATAIPAEQRPCVKIRGVVVDDLKSYLEKKKSDRANMQAKPHRTPAAGPAATESPKLGAEQPGQGFPAKSKPNNNGREKLSDQQTLIGQTKPRVGKPTNHVNRYK